MAQSTTIAQDHLELSNAVHYALMLSENILKRTDLTEDQKDQYLAIHTAEKMCDHKLTTNGKN